MGLAVCYLNAAVAKFQAAEQYVAPIGGAYKDNWTAKLAEARALCEKASKENKSVYYEKETGDMPKPDPQNFVNLTSCMDKMNEVPALDAKLCHLVPPQVRALQDQLKNTLQGVV